MKIFNKFKRPISALLAVMMVIPSNITPVFASSTSKFSEEAFAESPVVDPSGFTLGIEWEDSEFKDGFTYNLYEDSDTSNAVKLRVSYSNNEVCEEGYKPGELILTVKGIGGVGRSGKIEATVGADKASEGTKKRDWSYTWNKASDTYTFTNNNEIEPNSVLSGYFDMVWTIGARGSVHLYSQDDIRAELLLQDGSSVVSNVLSFTNVTKCDTHSVSIEKAPMFSYEGLVANIPIPDDYTYVKYNLDTNTSNKSRGVNSSRYIFNPDAKGVGSGAIVIPTVTSARSNGDGTYTMGLSNNTLYGYNYVFVAYPKSEYSGKTVEATLTMYGTYYEGDDLGNTEEKQLAEDIVAVPIPNDFGFSDPLGYEYGYEGFGYSFSKDTYYDRHVSNSVIEERGGDVVGNKMVSGTTETFYLKGRYIRLNGDLSGTVETSVEENTVDETVEESTMEETTGVSTVDDLLDEPGNMGVVETYGRQHCLEIADDFLYILKNNGDYRQLEAGEYEFKELTIPGTSSLLNSNNLPIEAEKYEVNVYAFTDGEVINTDDLSNRVFVGTLNRNSQTVGLPENTTAIEVVFINLGETIKDFDIPVKVEFHIKDTSDLEWEEQDNLVSGQVVNTSFIQVFDNMGTWYNNNWTEDNYLDGDINIDLAAKDMETYGCYLDRERDNISFYEGDKSDYDAYTSISEVEYDGRKYFTNFTMGANFDFHETDTPDKFSLYTVLPDHLEINGYDIEEDLWDVLNFSGMGLSADVLAEHCIVDINENYKDSGRTYIGLHFDFSDLEVPQNGQIRVSFKAKIAEKMFKKSTNLYVRSVVVIDEDINEFKLGKTSDNGSWGLDKEVESDIDNDGDTKESLDVDYDSTYYVYVDSSEFQMSKSVKTSNIEDYVQLPDVPLAEEGSDYSYEISIRNGASISKNIVVTDVLENGPNAEWKGTFKSVDLSDAEKNGLNGKVYYSESTEPGALDSGKWVDTLEPEKVKAIAVDFGDSQLDPGDEANIYVNMTAPVDETLRGKITENNFSASFTMIDKATGNVTGDAKLDSNYVQVKLTAELKNIIMTKVDGFDDKRLADVKFELINKETEEVVAKGTTNAKGQIIFKRIPSDVTYILREVEAPVGYEMAEDVEVAFDTSKTKSVIVENQRKHGSAAIFKTNALNNLVRVEGAEYTLYDSEGSQVGESVATDINGRALFEDINWGNYYIQETKAPDGYALDDTKYEFEITKENVDEQVKFNVKDEQTGTTKVRLVKYEMSTTGVQTDIPLSGAAFRLVNVTGGSDATVGTYVTDSNGEIIVEDLAYGNYKFIESRIPTGFTKVDDVEFSVMPDSMEAERVVYNKRKTGKILIYKHDNLDNIVKGAVFELYDETKNNVLGTYTTNEYGNIEIKDLEWGTYYIREKSTLECYVLNEEWVEVVIDRKHLNVDLDIENQTKKGTVVLTKTNEIGKTVLKGAEFTLYHEDGSIVTLTDSEGNEVQQAGLVTDENGQIRVEGLEWGKYYFKETKAPTGFGLTDETVRFAVNAMNAGTEQAITVTNPEKSNVITLTKKILVEDVNFANGNPTFLFKVTGTDVTGKEHTYHRIMSFDENYVNARTDEDGFVSQSVTISGVMAGVYTASEEESSRYILESDMVEGIGENTVVRGEVVDIDLTYLENGGAVFVNSKYEHGDFSDNATKANVIKEQAKLTAIKVSWNGEETVEARTEIDRSLVGVVAMYDDGTTRELASDEWSFGSDFSGSKFPNINGDYEIPIEYTENGITKGGSFFVTIYGAKAEIVRLEAAVKEEFQTVEPESALEPYMYDVTAVYSDGSRKLLVSPICAESAVPPNGVGVDLQEFHFEDAKGVKIIFEYANASKHNISIQANTVKGKVRVENLYNNYTNKEVTVLADGYYIGDYVEILYEHNTYDPISVGEVWKADIIPLDENGNEIFEFFISPTTAPPQEGLFDVEISLNPDLYEEEVSTTVTQEAKLPEPILMQGYYQKSSSEAYFNKLIPSTATAVVFTDEVVPEGYSSGTSASSTTYVDLSEAQNGTVVGWLEGTTFKVSSQRTGVRVVANEDSSKMFYQKFKLTNIDLAYLDTSSVTTMYYMFYNCSKLTSLDLSSFDTSSVTTMSSMFYDCRGLTSLDVSSFDTSNVTTMYYMFRGCSGLTSLDLSSFDTSSVTTMSYMFYGCSKLTSLDLSSFDTSSVTTMSSMFGYCSGLTSLDLSSFDTSSVTNMSYMFSRCSGLTSLDVSSFDTSSVTDMSNMFYGCSKLTSLDLSSFNTSNVTTMSYMFYGCSGLTSLDLSSFNTSNVTTMSYMFSRCSGLTSLDLSSFATSSVTTMSSMFDACSGLTSLDLSSFDTSSVTTMSSMFGYCSGLTSLDVSSFDTSKVTNMSNMFYDCRGLTSLDVSSFATSSVTTMSSMFGYCSGLTSLDLSSFDTSSVTYMSDMFKGCSGLTSLDLSSFDTSSVTNISNMFGYCSGLTSLDLSSFDTSSVTNMSSMFYSCSGLTSLDVSSFATSSVTYMSDMFKGCSGLTSLDLSSFGTSSVTTMSNMFYNCSGLTSLDVSSFDTSKVTNMSNMFYSCSSVVDGQALARCQADADRLNASVESSGLPWRFNSAAPAIDLTVEIAEEYRDLVTVNIPEKVEGGFTKLTVEPIGDVAVYSFVLDGEEIIGDTFTAPMESGTVTISEVKYLKVDNECSDLVSVSIPDEIEPGVTEINLVSKEENKGVSSFKYSYKGVEYEVSGDSFVAPENDGVVTITEVTLVDQVIIESEHNPYPNSMNTTTDGLQGKVYGEATFDDATSLTVELDYQTESTNYDWIYLYDADGNIVNSKKYGGTTRKTETITVSGNYVKVLFRTDGSGNNYYGFKATITPVYE